MNVPMPPNQFCFCILATPTFFVTTMCSTFSILSMTFDRFYSIIRPHKSASFNTIKRAKVTIASIVALSIVYNFPHFFLASPHQTQCVPYAKAGGILGQLYYWLSFVIQFGLPFVSLLIMNSVIIHTIRKSFNIKGKKTGNEEGQGQGEGQSKSSEMQIYVTLLLVTFSFLILTTPAYAYFLYVNFFDYTKTVYRYAGFYLLGHASQKALHTNYAVNFFLYVISGQKFRGDLVKLFKCNNRKLSRKMELKKKTDLSQEKQMSIKVLNK